MVTKKDFQRVGTYVWELPREFDPRMQVPARVYGSDPLLEMAFGDASMEQLVNVAMLPGIVGCAMAMPDVHQGYGFPIGGVAAFRQDKGIISPGGLDTISKCGVRMLASALDYEEIAPHLEALITRIYQTCPSGVGEKGAVQLSQKELDRLLEEGAEWAVSKGYATRDDVLRTEDGGRLPGARAELVPARAKERGRPQLGSLGGGNHFMEIDVVDEVYDPDVAAVFGIALGRIVVQIHCGSRGLGHEVCTQYLRQLQGAPQHYGFTIPDRELVAAPVDSPEGRDYLSAMAAAANYAFVNRQVLAHYIRLSFERVLAGKVRNWHLHQVYDVTHNIAKLEKHPVGGKLMSLMVHRKGATRAFGPGHADLPDVYREIGQPVLVPGSMGTAVLRAGRDGARDGGDFGSTCHGAGRTMSRNEAKPHGARGESARGSQRAGHCGPRREYERPGRRGTAGVQGYQPGGGGCGWGGAGRKVARVVPIAVVKG
jgi:tRNA-splicing ligase RtcB